MTSTATFFIADRLRGIPLVTGGRSNLLPPTTTTPSIPTTVITTERTSTINMEPISTSRLKISADTMKLVQVEKRETNLNRHLGANNPRMTTIDSNLLFKPAAMTASTANIVRNKVTTTSTRRPPTTTTTRKWKPTSKVTPVSSIIKRVTPKRPNRVPTVAQVLMNSEAFTTTSTTTTTPASSAPELAFTTTMRSLTDETAVATSTVGKLTPPTGTRDDRQMTYSTPMPIPRHTSTVPNLTRTSNAMTTQPLNQRRTPQTINFPRYSNRLNDASKSAGENWVLFNRPDGGFSVFEILVLCSNILIVGAIVMVIFMSWMKSMKKRRAQRNQSVENGENPSALSNAPMQSQISHSQPVDGISDRGSKLSMVSSGISNLDSATISDSSHHVSSGGMAQPTRPAEQVAEHSARNADSTLTAIESKVADAIDAAGNSAHQLVGASHNISSEIKTSGINVANKAMAIVQPTGSSTAGNLSPKTDSEKMGNSIKDDLMGHSHRAINRSVSDLSGSAKLRKDLNEPTNDSKESSSKVNGDEVNGSAPNLPTLTDTKPVKEPAKAGDKLDNFKRELMKKERSNSLESIELPGELVESIKKSGPRIPDQFEAPSPNMLLGESNEQQQKTPENAPKRNDQEADRPTEEKKNAQLASVPTKISAEISRQPKEVGKPVETPKTSMEDTKSSAERPQNPMSRQLETKDADGKRAADATERQTAIRPTPLKLAENSETDSNQPAAQVKNHQIVVNKLDKRKTNLEIVDLRDESVTGKMRSKDSKPDDQKNDDSSGWISMDGLAVVQPATNTQNTPGGQQQQQQTAPQTPTGIAQPIMSPSEIIESRFHVDYSSKRRNNQSAQPHNGESTRPKQQDSMDSKTEENLMNNIENELEMDNKMKNRKYFVYIVHDGHFTAKKECIARIELPPKRKITLAELRQLIASSQDISLSSLRRNRFKFVTETYRLLNENEDAAVLHQVYPTQGVFLKLNVAEQENQVYPLKGRARLSSGSGGTPSSLAQTTIASRRRATNRTGQPRAFTTNTMDPALPAIEVEPASELTPGYGRSRAVSVGRRPAGAIRTNARPAAPGGAYRRSKSSVQATGRRPNQRAENYSNSGSSDRLPSIGRSIESSRVNPTPKVSHESPIGSKQVAKVEATRAKQTLGETASEMGSNVLSGAKRLLNNLHF